jgi:hypothetical protein
MLQQLKNPPPRVGLSLLLAYDHVKIKVCHKLLYIRTRSQVAIAARAEYRLE